MIQSLTSSQKKIYDFYKEYISRNGNSPTYSVSANSLKISEPAIYKHILKLESLGYLNRDNGGKISLFSNEVKVLGYVSCGYGIDLIEEEIQKIEVPTKMISKGGTYYGLIAKGDSMINAHISDGDILIIRQQNTIENGDIGVVVKDDDTVTLKRVFKRSSDILLRPENDNFSSIILQNCEVKGKLVGVIREF